MSEWMQRIIESKRAARREFAALPYGEKLRIVERLREAAQMFRASRPPKPANPVRIVRG
jgi:hypothetical protein